MIRPPHSPHSLHSPQEGQSSRVELSWVYVNKALGLPRAYILIALCLLQYSAMGKHTLRGLYRTAAGSCTTLLGPKCHMSSSPRSNNLSPSVIQSLAPETQPLAYAYTSVLLGPFQAATAAGVPNHGKDRQLDDMEQRQICCK
jgi:hypothetical protein